MCVYVYIYIYIYCSFAFLLSSPASLGSNSQTIFQVTSWVYWYKPVCFGPEKSPREAKW